MRVVLAACLLLSAIAVSGASADPSGRAMGPSADPFMRVYGSASPPFGFVQFCDRQPEECAGQGILQARFDANPQRFSELDQINRMVNAAIRPATDEELYGVRELWTLPTDAGDCEDYVLLKRQILIKRGWPVGSLLITVVRDERGDGHAVLTARTSHGDFVLDNKVDAVRLWSQTGYQFIMRQSYVDPKLWMSLAPVDNDGQSVLTSNPSAR